MVACNRMKGACEHIRGSTVNTPPFPPPTPNHPYLLARRHRGWSPSLGYGCVLTECMHLHQQGEQAAALACCGSWSCLVSSPLLCNIGDTMQSTCQFFFLVLFDLNVLPPYPSLNCSCVKFRLLAPIQLRKNFVSSFQLHIVA